MHLMQSTFRAELDKTVLVFLDDILVYSKSIEEHREHLAVVLDRLREKQLYAKFSKCEFYMPEVEFLGHIVGQHGLKMVHDKLAAIDDWPTPTSQKDVEQFLGLAGYYRRFIKNFSAIAAPLSALTGTRSKRTADGKKPEPKVFEWGADQLASFLALKVAVTSAPCLVLPDQTKDYVIHTDASGGATGAALMQDQGDGLQPVAFMSKKMNQAEQNYSTRDQEYLAIKQACGTWARYLLDRHFTIHTDHESLQFIGSAKLPTRRHNRWEILLADFDFTIKYIKGEKNGAADGLSRAAAAGQAEASEVEPDQISAISRLPLEEMIRRAVHRDLKYRGLCAVPVDMLAGKGLRMKNGFLYRSPALGGQLVIPSGQILRTHIMHEMHDVVASGHGGRDVTLARVKQRFHWG